MSEGPTGSAKVTSGGIAAAHPPVDSLAVRVAPTGELDDNTFRTPCMPLACWRMDDVGFDFDSSFVRPDIGPEIQNLWRLREEQQLPDEKTGQSVYPRLSVFGHADPIGDDAYNKKLSGRRVKAIYALLTRNTEMWDDLFQHPIGKDDWKQHGVLEAMRSALPEDGPNFTDDQREALYLAYMDQLCTIRDEDGKPLKDSDGQDLRLRLDPGQDFLAAGLDAGGKGDFQGCSEFNPVIMFSQKDHQELSQASRKTERDQRNAPNRRVVAFLFQPGLMVERDSWPCPRADEGVTGCRKRFWSDAAKRRQFQEEQRTAGEQMDTFACRFYDRLAIQSPCERSKVVGKTFRLQIVDYKDQPQAKVSYEMEIGRSKFKGTTDPNGFTQFHPCAPSQGTLRVKEMTYEITFEAELKEEIAHMQSLLNLLGFNAGPLDGKKGRRTTHALKAYQRARNLDVTGEFDETTRQALRKEHLLEEF